MKLQQINELKVKCAGKPQLRNYVTFKNFDDKPPFLIKPLSFIQRKLLCKLCTSCLEIRICTGRFQHLPEEERICTVSEDCIAGSLVETEGHFLLHCVEYMELRQEWLNSCM